MCVCEEQEWIFQVCTHVTTAPAIIAVDLGNLTANRTLTSDTNDDAMLEAKCEEAPAPVTFRDDPC